MSEPRFETLGAVLKDIQNRNWLHSLYGATRPPWTADTLCVVLERDTYSEEVPEFARRHSLRDVLSVHQAQGIVENARRQLAEPGVDELVQAFNYYFKKDAFIRFTER
ncbi:hypothetical protein HPC49_17935 [Pyxidicoccus fallax]|uniref:DUF7716 domain-containing protein n=1 Tax=Pyxidicoccus fallax TaxID=394095 RepID=A0A848LLF7_9BACT|nr:hypothetical protein [Pyxidicoccus fallax]NMO18512.1 hypothetical protein [Pyxidicoccus fallax]NPC80092.1 hypothetical protein [Pyxidicoccus fallax]